MAGISSGPCCHRAPVLPLWSRGRQGPVAASVPAVPAFGLIPQVYSVARLRSPVHMGCTYPARPVPCARLEPGGRARTPSRAAGRHSQGPTDRRIPCGAADRVPARGAARRPRPRSWGSPGCDPLAALRPPPQQGGAGEQASGAGRWTRRAERGHGIRVPCPRPHARRRCAGWRVSHPEAP